MGAIIAIDTAKAMWRESELTAALQECVTVLRYIKRHASAGERTNAEAAIRQAEALIDRLASTPLSAVAPQRRRWHSYGESLQAYLESINGNFVSVRVAAQMIDVPHRTLHDNLPKIVKHFKVEYSKGQGVRYMMARRRATKNAA